MAEKIVIYIRDEKVIREITTFSPRVRNYYIQIAALHEAIKESHPQASILEVSTYSNNQDSKNLGRKLSAFKLKLDGTYLENVFQASKHFENGGPYMDLLAVEPKLAKKDTRLKSSGRLLDFQYQGLTFSKELVTLFYDYIYYLSASSALSTDEQVQLASFDCFTDIALGKNSKNTQAEACALLACMIHEFGTIPNLSWDEFTNQYNKYVAPISLND